MITFITALYPEAKAVIARYKLKQQLKETTYQLFEGESVRLVITGAGMISAATAAARHFALYPPESAEDIVINLGIAGLVPGTASMHTDAAIGDLFLVSRITELSTGRTFYPDLLYRHPFCQLPTATAPVVFREASGFAEDTLVDMEASALYQALLPHFTPDRMIFFKVVSDIPGQKQPAALRPEELLAPHMDAIVSYAEQLHDFLYCTRFKEPAVTAEVSTLVERIYELLPMTESMAKEFQRLLTYAGLSGIPLASVLQHFLDSLPETAIRGKKQAMPYLSRLRELILNAGPAATKVCSTAPKEAASAPPTSMLMSPQ